MEHVNPLGSRLKSRLSKLRGTVPSRPCWQDLPPPISPPETLLHHLLGKSWLRD